MHEFSLATGLMQSLLDVAQANRLRHVREVEVSCGVLQQVVPEAFQFAFEALSAGTVAEGAVLRILDEGLRARCRACGAEFDAVIDNYLCAACKTADVEIIAGRDMVLRSVVGETDDEVAA